MTRTSARLAPGCAPEAVGSPPPCALSGRLPAGAQPRSRDLRRAGELDLRRRRQPHAAAAVNSKPKPKPKPLTRAQKLAKALKACKKKQPTKGRGPDANDARARQAKAAGRKYGPRHAARKSAKKSSKSSGSAGGEARQPKQSGSSSERLGAPPRLAITAATGADTSAKPVSEDAQGQGEDALGRRRPCASASRSGLGGRPLVASVNNLRPASHRHRAGKARSSCRA